MANRIKAMRSALVLALAEAGAPGNWSHITSQVRAGDLVGVWRVVSGGHPVRALPERP